MFKIKNELDKEGFYINNVENVMLHNFPKNSVKTNEYFVIYIAFEKSEISLGETVYNVPKDHLVFIGPYKNITLSPSCLKNVIIVFSSEFYEKSVKDSFILNSELFFNLNKEIVITPAIGNGSNIREFIIDRLDLYRKKEHGIYIAVAHNCVEILILDGILALEESSDNIYPYHSSYLETVNKFRILLQKYYKREKSVAFYSDVLCVSPQRLSVMTKEILGKGAKKLVVEKISNEALKLLENSTLNISEISNELGFVDEANFSTFVKKNLGRSPSEVRNLLLSSKKISS